jgi:RNA polymerase sigma-70 factor (ECF subfamily)
MRAVTDWAAGEHVPGDTLAAAARFRVRLPFFEHCSMSDFEGTYEKYVDVVFRYTCRCVGRSDVAEDITSEVFLTFHRDREGIDPSQLPAWLFTVAKHKAIDYWRRTKVEQRYLQSLPPPEVTWSPPLEMWLRETKALKAVHRACLILRYVHGMGRSEIGQRLGLSETQVKGHLQYARTILRHELAKVPE